MDRFRALCYTGAALGVAAVVAFGVAWGKANQIYKGPVDIPGVTSVNAFEAYDTNIHFSNVYYIGNVVRVNLEDGTLGIIRDRDGDLLFNSGDSISGSLTEDLASDVLREVRTHR